MYNKILVALDNSDASEAIFKQALELGQAMQAQLMLVHSLSSDEEGSPMPFPPEVEGTYWMPGADSEMTFDLWRETWERYETEGIERLRKFAAIANEANVPTEFRQMTGNPGKVICKIAQQWGADLIVMGHRGRSGLTELVLGSVSNYVMHRARCSVLIMKVGARVDSSEDSLKLAQNLRQ
jgi:nucleotide-binding universal stress UspA family protein